MKKKYSFLCFLFLFIASGSLLNAQIIINENFENGVITSDFPGWDTDLPPFDVTSINACEGTQSMRADMHSGNINPYLEFLFPPNSLNSTATGQDIEVSFEYRIIDSNDDPVTGNFGYIDLLYTIDGGSTWQIYDTIDENDLPTSGCSSYSYTILGTNVPVGSDFGLRIEANWNQGDYFVDIDQIRAVEQVACIQPINLSLDSVAYDEAEISWEDINSTSPGTWEITVCTSNGYPQINPTCGLFLPNITSANEDVTITGLDDGETYYVYVRSNCGSDSNWAGPIELTTLSYGTDCSAPKEINSDPLMPVAGDLPYNDSSSTEIYGDTYSGSPGANCGGSSSVLSGYDVVYHYTPSADDILTIDVTNISGVGNVGVFVYEDCDDIGDFCVGGDVTTIGEDLNVNSVFVDQGQDYYIVIASLNNSGNPGNADYDLSIEGFDCSTWIEPDGDALVDFVDGQTLSDFSTTGLGVNPTIFGATLTWYEDDNGVQGSEITSALENINLLDGDVYWVTQNIAGCESPVLEVTFNEFNCLTDLGGITNTQGDFVCESGSVTLEATANTNNIYWFDTATGGEPIYVGANFSTPNITENTSYWVTEVFIGESEIANQANPGPVTSSTSSSNYGLQFEAYQPFTLVSVDVYVVGSGNLTLQLDGPSGQLEQSIIPLTAGTSSSPQLNKLTLNWEIPASGTYTIRKIDGPSMMYTPSSNVSYPFNISSVADVTSGYLTSSTSSNYYYFYNWTVTGPAVLCESARIEVVAGVEEIIPTSVSSDETYVCVGGGSTDLHVESTNPNYDYTWSWSDSSGSTQTGTGSTITVSPEQPTVYTVIAVDNITGCEYENEIEIETRGVDDIPLRPENIEICSDEMIQLSAGGEQFGFEDANHGWTTVNNSQTVGGASVSSAEWQMVMSPYGPIGGASSNDNSQFFVTNADAIGPGGSLDTQLISPSFNLVGVASVELSFYHYFRRISTQTTTASVDVSVNYGPWQSVQTFTSTVGEPTNFVGQTISLNDYTGNADVRIRFSHSGGWGWYWAVDNVNISRTYIDGVVSWTPTTNLFFDEAGTLPYDGTPAVDVYFSASQAGQYDYSANLNILECTSVDGELSITVNDTDPPIVSDSEQYFEIGDVVSDLEVTGTNLVWFIEDENGDYQQVTINYPLEDGEVYYVRQTQNDCESELVAITALFDCPGVSDLTINMEVDSNNLVDGVLTWTAPANTDGIEQYFVVIYDENGDIYNEYMINNGNTFVVIDDMPQDQDFEAEVYSICVGNDVYSDSEFYEFNTLILSVDSQSFSDLSYYPNPTNGRVFIKNSLPIEKLELYGLTGQRIFSKEVRSNETTVDLSNMATGVYFVNLTIGNSTKVVRIIKD